MDRCRQVVLDWINSRRTWLDRPELDDLEPANEDHHDPVSASLGARWVLGSLQCEDTGRIYQYDKTPAIDEFLVQWRAGRYPQYDRRD